MSTDLEQFYEVFFEESTELLAEMESCLLGLDVNSPDMEDMNAIFRAAHSIKGGAGTFGFKDMTEMTHMLETLLDRLRKGELEVRSEMIDAFLKAGDVIKDQLAGHRGDGEADPAAAAAVCEELSRFSEETSDSVDSVQAPAAEVTKNEESVPPVAQATETGESESAVAKTIFLIEFPSEGVSEKAQENLLSNLGGMGQLEKIALDASEPKSKLRLITDSTEEDIWEILAFVVDPENLKIDIEASAEDSASAELPVDGMDGTSEPEEPYGFFPEAPGNTTKPYGIFPDAPAAPAGAEDDEGKSGNNKVTVNAKNKSPGKAAANSAETSSIRVSIEKVDQLINLVGELVITQAMLAQTASEVDPVVFENLLSGMNQLERNTRDLQESVMSIRMLPISFVFSRFPRVVRDLASTLNKQIELKQVGEGTELDKGLIEKIADPLTHLIRNSLDHGVEMPDVRIAAGKPAQGTITLRAFHQGGNIVIEVGDDGAGLNREKILAKAKERGLQVSDDMPDSEVWMLIFEAGFSTAAVVTDVSGRGVGMDVVKRNISAMGGRVDIESALGVGTRISVRLPLTLAILDGLSVGVGDQMFIVPLTYIIESLQPVAEDIKSVSGRGRVVQVRGEYLPVIALHEVFNLKPTSEVIHDGILVILEAEGRKAAMLVDTLIGQHQVVIKSLESNYRRVQGVSGATIMGDGKVALILDTAALVTSSHRESV